MKTVAIIAPMHDEFSKIIASTNFLLRFKNNQEELTMESIYHLANNSYNINSLTDKIEIKKDKIAPSGYYLSSFLRLNNYNTIITSLFDDDSLREIEKQSPIAVCISTSMIVEKESLAIIINEIRKVMKDVIIIVGGVFVWKGYLWIQHAYNLANNDINKLKPYEMEGVMFPCNKHQIDADAFVVSRHGGDILLMLLNEIIKNGKGYNFSDIPNLALPNNKGLFCFTKRIDEEIDYNQVYTHWELIDELPYNIPIRTSVGCYSKCKFCDFCHLYPKVILRSMNSIKSELKTIKNLMHNQSIRQKIRGIHFTDDNLFISPNRFNKVCNSIIDMDLGLFWTSFFRASSVNDSNIKLLKRAGLARAWIGVESGDQKQLNRMNKKQNLEEVKRGIELLDMHGVVVHMFYVVGFPGEDDITINNTIDFLNNLKVSNSYYKIYPLVIVPMSDLSLPETRKKWNVKGMFLDWSHKTMTTKLAIEKSKFLFKNVTNTPYCYPYENHFFLKRYDYKTRKKLFSLRHKITVGMIEHEPWQKIALSFLEMAKTMGINPKIPGEQLKNEIIYPDF